MLYIYLLYIIVPVGQGSTWHTLVCYMRQTFGCVQCILLT